MCHAPKNNTMNLKKKNLSNCQSDIDAEDWCIVK